MYLYVCPTWTSWWKDKKHSQSNSAISKWYNIHVKGYKTRAEPPPFCPPFSPPLSIWTYGVSIDQHFALGWFHSIWDYLSCLSVSRKDTVSCSLLSWKFWRYTNLSVEMQAEAVWLSVVADVKIAPAGSNLRRVWSLFAMGESGVVGCLLEDRLTGDGVFIPAWLLYIKKVELEPIMPLEMSSCSDQITWRYKHR